MPDAKDYRLMIASGFYEVKAYAPQISCLMSTFKALEKIGLDYTYIQICGDSYVSRCKNSMVHQFLKSDYTHLMIIDSDETWELGGFLRLLKASMRGCEIAAGLYPCKNNWDFFGGQARRDPKTGYVYGKELEDMRLIDMEIAPGGFIIYSREAFERTRPILDSYHAPEINEDILECFKNGVAFDHHPKSDGELALMSKDDLIDWVKINQQGGRVGHHTGEDIYFQVQYKRMGGKIWCEPNIDMGHIGVKEWKGNYQDHLLSKAVPGGCAT
jgi:hypothetical protein